MRANAVPVAQSGHDSPDAVPRDCVRRYFLIKAIDAITGREKEEGDIGNLQDLPRARMVEIGIARAEVQADEIQTWPGISVANRRKRNDSMPSGWGRSGSSITVRPPGVADEEVSPNLRKPRVHAPARGKAVTNKALTRRNVCRGGQAVAHSSLPGIARERFRFGATGSAIKSLDVSVATLLGDCIQFIPEL